MNDYERFGDSIRTVACDRWLSAEEVYQLLCNDPSKFNFAFSDKNIVNPQSSSLKNLIKYYLII
jgi:hypothetical protein